MNYDHTPQAVCFLIPEIVGLICHQVQTLLESRDSNNSLAVLARTCRFFHEPAVSRLWYDLESLAPLIMCMPEELWQRPGDSSVIISVTSLELRRDIRPPDFTRALQYASHIRRFGFRRDLYLMLPLVHSTVYKTIREAVVLAGEVLFPNITALKLLDSHPILPHIEYLIGPFIESVELPMSIDQGLLSTIASRYPTLQHVDFTEYFVSSTPRVIDVVSTAICVWSRLHTLSVNGLTPTALTRVASLPNLRCLSLKNLANTFTLPKFPFPALCILTLHAETPLQCVKFMEDITLRNFTKVILSFNDATPSGWTALVDVLLKSCSPLSLLELSLLLTHGRDGRYKPGIQIVQPLFVFSNLTSLQIEPCEGLNDRFIQDLSQAWPRLRNLYLLDLMSRRRQLEIPRVTLPGLVPLAKSCPDLESLAILLDTRTINGYRSRPGGGVRNFSVTSLNVGYSPITSAHLVATFLSDIFPNVIDLKGGCDDGSWEELEELTLLLASVRLQEQVYQADKTAVTNAQNDT